MYLYGVLREQSGKTVIVAHRSFPWSMVLPLLGFLAFGFGISIFNIVRLAVGEPDSSAETWRWVLGSLAFVPGCLFAIVTCVVLEGDSGSHQFDFVATLFEAQRVPDDGTETFGWVARS